MRPKVLFRNQVSQRSGAQSKLATLAACNPSWLVKPLDEQDSSFMRALFHWESNLRKFSHLEYSSPSFEEENRQVHKKKYEGYSVSLHGSKQIAD